MDASILHADLDAFYASVEQLLQPALRGKPIAVGGGVVLAASYEARAFGVRSGMPGRRARELCPELVFTGGHFSEYQRLGDAAIAVLADYTPDIERISIDEAFADVSGSRRLFGAPAAIAAPGAGAGPRGAWPADLHRRRAHQAPGEDRLPGRQARWPRSRRSRRGARLPARPAGRADVGGRPGDEAAAGGRRRRDDRPAGAELARVDGASAGPRGRSQAEGARLEPRPAGDSERARAPTRPALSRRWDASPPRSGSSAPSCSIWPTASRGVCAPRTGPAGP